MPPLQLETARRMAFLLRSKQISAVELVEAHLEQISNSNPKLNAIVTLTAAAALERALLADAATLRGECWGPLHGMPVVHKDLLDTKGVLTTYGSKIYANHVPHEDSLVVERMAAAGAICLGKTNTPEFGAGSQTYNEVFGATGNPFDPSKTCGGSSGGSAVALATGMAPFATGTDLGGSLRNPASFCGVVGMRCAPGRVPNWPTLNAWFPLDVHGPMARNVADLAMLLAVIAGPDQRSPISIAQPGSVFGGALDAQMKGKRIAFFDNLGGVPFDAEVKQRINEQRKVFESMGCIVAVAEPNLDGADESFRILRAWNAALNHASRIAAHPGVIKQTLVREVQQGQDLGAFEVARAEKLRTELFHRVRKFFETYDAFVLPTVQVLPFPLEQLYVNEINGVALNSYIEWMKSCYLISATGHPAISVPAGKSESGLPIGMQIVGRHQGERELLEIAYAYEVAAG